MHDEDIQHAIAELARDDRSSASALLERVVAILQQVIRDDPSRAREVGGWLCQAQPSMASVWCAVGAAWQATDGQSPTPLERFVERVRRAPAIIASRTVELLTLGTDPDTPLVIVTCSASLTVAACVEALARERPVRVACAESRPAVEGRAMAERLARHGLDVDLYTDAAVGRALDGADALVVGADCVAPAWVVNKCGTRLLAAAASQAGLPVYVTAGRDKMLPQRLAERLALTEGPARDVWARSPPRVSVKNPFFERVPHDLITAVVSDAGVLAGEMVGAACEARAAELDVARLIERAEELTNLGS